MSSPTRAFSDLDGLPQGCNLVRYNEFEKHRRGGTDQDLCVAAVIGERAEIVPCLRQREAIQPIAGQTSCQHQAMSDVQTAENDTWDVLLLLQLPFSHRLT